MLYNILLVPYFVIGFRAVFSHSRKNPPFLKKTIKLFFIPYIYLYLYLPMCYGYYEDNCKDKYLNKMIIL